jgi:GT2 family glycosyltransferase
MSCGSLACRENEGLTIERSSSPAIAIGVPVRNEVARLPRLLAALQEQDTRQAFTLCLLFDNCDDGSEELVAGWAGRLRYRIVTDRVAVDGPANAGAARRRAMALALGTIGDDGSRGALLTTDADSAPAADWIDANLAGLDQAEVVAGRIVRGDAATPDMQTRVAAYYDRLHALRRMIDPVPWESFRTHHWTSGASLGFRADVYRRLGGFAPLASGEDAAFVDIAMRAGYRVRRDADVVVCTSSRRHGRAEHGFAAALAALDASAIPPQVVHPDDEAWRFRMQAAARDAFQTDAPDSLAQALGLAAGEVGQVASECANGEAFAARIVGTPPAGLRMVSLAHAEALLTGLDSVTMAGVA